MITSKRIAALALVAYCGCGTEAELTGAAGQALALDTGAFGSVPIPVESFGGSPRVVGGKPIQNWDGSVVELIAADAWAECSRERPLPALEDEYLTDLQLKMSGALCVNTNLAGNPAGDWYFSRRDAACNVDPVTLESRPLPPVSRPSLNAYQVTPVNLNDTAAVRAATRWAQAEVSYAEQNLCMARRLAERLEGETALFASSEQQLDLLNVVRHRAQAAVIQHIFLAKVAIGTQPLGSASRTLTTDAQYLRLLQRWLVSASRSAIGENFAAAIELHARVTEQLGRLLLRVGSQRDPSAGVDRPTADFGPSSGRTRLLRLLYGGDPIAPTQDSEPQSGEVAPVPIEVFGTYDDPAFRQRRQYVREDVRRPQVGVLLGLARRANALWLHRTEQPFVEPVNNQMDFARRQGFSFLVDEPASSTRIYQEVEADLRARQCELGKEEFCDAALPAEESEYLLQKFHAVLPEDAASLVGMLSDAVPSRTRVELQGAPSDVFVFTGAFHVPGVHEVAPDPDDAEADWVRLDPDFFVSPLAPHEQAQAYSAPVLIPRSLDLRAAGPEQGMIAILTRPGMSPAGAAAYPGTEINPYAASFANAPWRRWGAVSVLAMARDAIEMGLEVCTGAACTLFQFAQQARPVLDAATGPRSVALRPSLEPVNVGPLSLSGIPAWLTVPSSNYYKLRYVRDADASPPTLEWTLDTVTDSSDDFEQVAYGSGNEPLRAATIAREHAGFFGETREALENLPVVDPEASSTRAGTVLRTHRFNLPDTQPEPTTGSQNVVFLKRGSEDFDTVRVFDYPATRNAWIGTSYGGTLNDLAATSRRVQTHNWSMPERDGFGIPYAWVPPADVALAGASSGEDAVAYYLRVARKAAEDATAAVQTAISSLREEELDQAALENSERRAAAITGLEQQGLCGAAAESGCDLDFTAWDPCTNDPPVRQSSCEANEFLQLLLPESFELASSVVAATEPAPTFSQFAGGSLQRLLIAQWNAKEALQRAIATYLDFVGAKLVERAAAQAVIDAAQPQLDQLQQIATRECSDAAFAAARQAGKSFAGIDTDEYPLVTPTGNGGFAWYTKYDNGASWSPGPAYAQADACQQANDQLASANLSLPAQVAQAGATIAGTYASENAQLGAVSEARAALLGTIADLLGAAEQSRIATARIEVDQRLNENEIATRFALRRKYQSFDLWRARALLESARKLAVTARRAIEGRFGVDLSELRAAEAFVAAPALWADEVYGTDLDAPSAVGLTQQLTEGTQIYPNKLVDYVSNLELFVQGYAIGRPTSVARGDTELISLPAPEATRSQSLDGVDVVTLDPASSGWLFFCANTGTWISHPGASEAPLVSRLATACGGKPPSRARLSFSLDPWGRLNGDYASPPFSQRHNARWSRMAVNIVGTGIRDCAASSDPLTCYNEAFLRYDLRHGGPAWITNYAQEWRTLGISAAFVESGKALSAEEWLDPVSNTWTVPLISNIARQELIERPLGGQYELVLDLTPDVRADRIERIQLLAETNYWVAQTP
jgi:hypothetical protein